MAEKARSILVDCGNVTVYGPDIVGVMDITEEERGDERYRFPPSARCIIRTSAGSVHSILDRATVVDRWEASIDASEAVNES